MSHRQKIVYMQIGAITVAIFLALLVGAAALTKVLNRREVQTDQKNAKQEQQEEKEFQILLDVAKIFFQSPLHALYAPQAAIADK